MPATTPNSAEGVAILVAADEDLFVDLLGRFPPYRYWLSHATDLKRARAVCDRGFPQLIVVDAKGWQLTPLLREARAQGQTAVLGVAGEDASWVPSAVDRVVPVGQPDEILSAACELVSERRKHPRAEVAMEVALGEGRRSVAKASSAGALFVPTDDPLEEGQEVDIEIDCDGGRVACAATVVRVGEGEDNERGMVLGVSEEAARRRIDAVVRRSMLSEHQRLASERGMPLEASTVQKLAVRSSRLLAEAFASAEAPPVTPVQGRKKIVVQLENLRAIDLPEDTGVAGPATARSELRSEAVPAAATTFGVESPTPIERPASDDKRRREQADPGQSPDDVPWLAQIVGSGSGAAAGGSSAPAGGGSDAPAGGAGSGAPPSGGGGGDPPVEGWLAEGHGALVQTVQRIEQSIEHVVARLDAVQRESNARVGLGDRVVGLEAAVAQSSASAAVRAEQIEKHEAALRAIDGQLASVPADIERQMDGVAAQVRQEMIEGRAALAEVEQAQRALAERLETLGGSCVAEAAEAAAARAKQGELTQQVEALQGVVETLGLQLEGLTEEGPAREDLEQRARSEQSERWDALVARVETLARQLRGETAVAGEGGDGASPEAAAAPAELEAKLQVVREDLDRERQLREVLQRKVEMQIEVLKLIKDQVVHQRAMLLAVRDDLKSLVEGELSMDSVKQPVVAPPTPARKKGPVEAQAEERMVATELRAALKELQLSWESGKEEEESSA